MFLDICENKAGSNDYLIEELVKCKAINDC